VIRMSFFYWLIVLLVFEETIEFFYRKKLSSTANRFKNINSDLEIVNIGSGPGLYAIDYSSGKRNGFNMSTAPQSFSYGFKLLKHYSKNIKDNAIIIIIIMCPLSFGNNQDYLKKGYGDQYYGVLRPSEIDDYSISRAFMVYHPIFFKCLSMFKRVLLGNNRIKNEIKQDEPSVVVGWKNQFLLKDLVDSRQAEIHKNAFKEKIEVINNIINFCKSNNWRPVFVIPPVPRNTRSYISGDFLSAFVYENLKQIEPICTLDYYELDDRVALTFSNDIFLSQDSKQVFSKILFEDIDELERECKI